MGFGKVNKHESYGLVGVSRVTHSHGTSLFGSSIKHSNTIRLSIKKAEVDRHLNRDWYHGRKQLIEIELSPTQFAEMITCMNMADGVPCTLRYLEDHKRLENPPEVKQREIFEQEFQNKVDKISSFYKDDFGQIKEILLKKGTIKVGDREQVANMVTKLVNTLADAMPFLQKSFNESIDKTVSEAKGEVEAFVMHKVTSLGIEGLQKEMIKLTEGK
jgi:hypothetical protein